MVAVQTETSNRLGLGDLSYGGPLTFSVALSGQLSVAPSTSIPTPTFSVEGTLPDGVTFDAATGRFSGPDAWNFDAVQVSGGFAHTCAVLTDSTARCWGWNSNGQLGDGTTTDRPNPVQVLASGTTQGTDVLTGITSITAGAEHTCAVLTDGTARCWGSNWAGQLGDGTTTNRTNPVQVLASGSTQGTDVLTGITSITASYYHTCAVLTDSTARCWGWNGYGQLGDGTTTDRTNPVPVLASGTAAASPVALTGVESIAAGGYHTCAVLTDSTARCWGSSDWGQLGDGTAPTQRTNPVQVLASGSTQGTDVLTGITSITAGAEHTCALLTDSTARCWGRNSNGQLGGQLGDGTTTNRPNPVQVLASGSTQGTDVLTGVTSITAGAEHTCAVLAGGTARCWGANGFGRLGDGTTTNRTNPVQVLASGSTQGTDVLTGVTSIAAGYYHTCAVTASGGAKCWGRNDYGQLGDGTPTQRETPVDVSGITGNPGWPATVTVSATDGTSTATAQVTLQKQ